MSDERLRRANAALEAYGVGMRELGRIAQEIVAPIRAKGHQEMNESDKAVVEAVTKFVDAISVMLDNVGKAIDD
jgi:hypothetical protein